MYIVNILPKRISLIFSLTAAQLHLSIFVIFVVEDPSRVEVEEVVVVAVIVVVAVVEAMVVVVAAVAIIIVV